MELQETPPPAVDPDELWPSYAILSVCDSMVEKTDEAQQAQDGFALRSECTAMVTAVPSDDSLGITATRMDFTLNDLCVNTERIDRLRAAGIWQPYDKIFKLLDSPIVPQSPSGYEDDPRFCSEDF